MKPNFTNGQIIHDKRKVVGICKVSDITEEYYKEYLSPDHYVQFDIKEVARAIDSMKTLVKDEPLIMLTSLKEPCPLLIMPERCEEDDPCISISPIVLKQSKWWR